MPLTMRDGSLDSWEGVRGAPNEDRAYIDRARQILLVADGQAGNGAAAELLVETVAKTPGNDLVAMIEAANTTIFDRFSGDQALRGSATSVVAVAIHGAEATYVHVGDSRLYLFRAGQLDQVTVDHTLANEALPGVPPEMTKNMPATARTRSVGAKATVRIDHGVVALQPGDALLLCSQGIHKALSDEEIAQTLSTPQSASEIVQALMAQADARKKLLDLTAALVRF